MIPATDAIGGRDTRVRLYSYSDAGADGVVSSTYTFVREVWARFTPVSANERSVAEAASHERRVRFGFWERIPVDENMVMVVAGEAYQAQGIQDARTYVPGLERTVEALWVDKATLTLVEP